MVLTLDEPDLQDHYGHEARFAASALRDVMPVEHLFTTVRRWFEHPPGGLVARDSEPLYRTHGDPRD